MIDVENKQIFKLTRPPILIGRGVSYCFVQNKTRSINQNVIMNDAIEALFEDTSAVSIFVYGYMHKGQLFIEEKVRDRKW